MTPTTNHSTDIGPFEASIALTGIVAVVLLAVGSMYFYGTGGETSAVALLGASLGTIGSIVGAVVGLGMGSKSGSAVGAAAQQASDAKTKIARSATQRAHNALTSFQQSTGLQAAAAPAGKPLTQDELKHQFDDAVKELDGALDDLK